ncbi:hemerythrin domain-containing protein [Geofilum sp. OHC36d9]|uniref:hemerythrin domain-containing protein n=1 Tax=Geofilum sp. OHC36d9 TaxID=3458413 RepID=UPI00403370BB
MNTNRYREQHEGILNAIENVNGKLKPEVILNNAREIRLLISGLFGKLKFHLSIEDKVIYPILLNHEDVNIANTAGKFFNEMGNIIEIINLYDKKWSNEHKIKANATEFIHDTQQILKKLVLRTEIENKELYKLVDELAY